MLRDICRVDFSRIEEDKRKVPQELRTLRDHDWLNNGLATNDQWLRYIIT